MLTDKEYISRQHERAIQALNRLKFAYNDINDLDCVDDVHNLIVKLEKTHDNFQEVE